MTTSRRLVTLAAALTALRAQMPAAARPPAIRPIDPNGPPFFTALQEQLGLKRQAARDPVDVIVIDGIERPSVD